jgi:hypothetical protein
MSLGGDGENGREKRADGGVEVKVKEEAVDEEKGAGLARSYSGAWP